MRPTDRQSGFRVLPRCGVQIVVLLFAILVVAGVCHSAETGAAPPADSDARYCEGLRARGLFRLAETYCLDQLAAEELSAVRIAELKLELARTWLAHSEQTIGDEQERLQKSALQTAEEALATARESRWGAELFALTAEVPASRAFWLTEEARLFPDDGPRRDEAIEALRAAIETARAVKQDLDREARMIPDRFRQNPTDISPFQHLVVRKEVDLLVGRLLCDLGELQFPESKQRGPAMRALQERIKLLCRGAEDESVTWRARLLHLRSCRLLADRESFNKYRQDDLNDLPDAYREAVIAEDAELALELDQPDRAAEMLHQYRQRAGRLPGELALINLRALARLWKTAIDSGDATLAGQLFQRIEQAYERAAAEVGGVRSWRCARFRDALVEAQRLGPELSAGIRQARSLFGARKIDEAAAAYGRLAGLAAQQQRPEVAAEMLFTQGSILLQQTQFGAAEPVFQALVKQFPAAEQAAQAHLLRAYCLGKIYEQSPTQSNREAYTQALQEHLDRFPNTVTWGDAALMLGQLEERRLQSTRAIEQYLKIDDQHPKAVAAHLALIRCYERIFARLKEFQQPIGEWQQQAVANLTKRVAAYPIEPERLDADRVRVMLSLARLKLEPGTAQFDEADDLLARVLHATAVHTARSSSTTESPDDARWNALTTEASQLRIISLASRGRPAEASAILNEFSTSDPDVLLRLLSGLSRVAAEVDARAARGIAELQLQTTLTLDRRRDQLNPAQVVRLDLCLAEAYAATDHSHEATLQYEKIIQQHPESDEARRELAKLLMVCGRPDCYRRALEQWRKLEAKTRQGTSEWFAIRKEVIAALIGAGQADEAAKLFRATELLYPEFGGGAIKAEYERLRAKLPSK